MKKYFLKTLTFFLTVAMSVSAAFTAAPVYAAKSKSQLQNEINQLRAEQKANQQKINSLKNDINKQEELKDAIMQQMTLVYKEIDACNRQINEVNSKIAANKAEIEKKNTETLALIGRLDTVTAPELEAEISAILPTAESLVLDMEKLEYISSAGLRVILKTQKALTQKAGLKLIHVSDDVREVFEITGFSDFLTIE